VEVALVRTGEAPVLTRGLLACQTGTHGALLERNLSSLGRSIRVLGSAGLLHLQQLLGAGHVLVHQLIGWDVVINSDTGQKVGGVLLESGHKHNAKGIHLM
jgi:hypothetical protein